MVDMYYSIPNIANLTFDILGIFYVKSQKIRKKRRIFNTENRIIK